MILESLICQFIYYSDFWTLRSYHFYHMRTLSLHFTVTDVFYKQQQIAILPAFSCVHWRRRIMSAARRSLDTSFLLVPAMVWYQKTCRYTTGYISGPTTTWYNLITAIHVISPLTLNANIRLNILCKINIFIVKPYSLKFIISSDMYCKVDPVYHIKCHGTLTTHFLSQFSHKWKQLFVHFFVRNLSAIRLSSLHFVSLCGSNTIQILIYFCL